MSHLPTIITDLAMILLVAGVTTILFKKINQPLVLGYIIAGFITGPNFTFFPTIADKVNVQAWSEIGVIFLLFALGLEFSFYKLKKVGSTALLYLGVRAQIIHCRDYFQHAFRGLWCGPAFRLESYGQHLFRRHAFHELHSHYYQGL